MRRTFRRCLLAVAATIATASATVIAVPTAVAEDTALLTGIRTGRHAHFDRIVLDLSGATPSVASQRYVAELTRAGSGRPVEIPGSSFLEITLSPAAAHDGTRAPRSSGEREFATPALHNVQAVAVTGDFENRLTIGLGLEHDTLYEVFTLENPARVVIDIGH